MERSVAWTVKPTSWRDKHIVVPQSHVALRSTPPNFQFAGVSGKLQVRTAFDCLLHRDLSHIWLVDQRLQTCHPRFVGLLTSDGHLVDTDFLLRFRITAPDSFLETLANGSDRIGLSELEVTISRLLHNRLLERTKQFDLEVLLREQRALDSISSEISGFLREILASWGAEFHSLRYLEFQESANAVGVTREKQKLQRQIDDLTLQGSIESLENHSVWLHAYDEIAGALTSADREELSELRSKYEDVVGFRSFLDSKLERLDRDVDSSAAPNGRHANMQIDDGLIDVWIQRVRVVGAAATLLTSLALFFRIEFFRDLSTSMLIIAVVGFGFAAVSFGLAEWRVRRRRQRSTSNGLRADVATRELPVENTPFLWHVDLPANDWSAVAYVSSGLVAMTNQKGRGTLTHFDVTPNGLGPRGVPALSESVVALQTKSAIVGWDLMDQQRLLITSGNAIGVYDPVAKTLNEFEIGDGAITTSPLVWNSAAFVVIRYPRNQSWLVRFDVRTNQVTQEEFLSNWAIRVDLIEMDGWLFVIDSDQIQSSLYRINPSTLHGKAIFKANHKIVAPMFPDRQRRLIWMSDVHGHCMAVNCEGELKYSAELPAGKQVRLTPFILGNELIVASAQEVYFVNIDRPKVRCLVQMSDPIVAVMEISDRDIGIADQHGHLVFLHGDAVISEKDLGLARSIEITTAVYNQRRSEMILAFSHSGMAAVSVGH